MSHRTSGEQEAPAVKSALKATLTRELAAGASAPKAATAPTEHLAGPGRLQATPQR
jgi:hypothetical protein